MPKTAYSPQFGGELDVEQFALLISSAAHDKAIDLPTAIGIAAASEAARELECPACFVKGATIVRGGRSRNGRAVFQPHFRFVGVDNKPAHHPLCDFYGSEYAASREGDVDFRKERSELTRAVRRLVCRGIERGDFDQTVMRSMREWHFRIKCDNHFRITTSANALAWCLDLWRSRAAAETIPFQPEFGDLPDFDWKSAAQYRLQERYKPVLDALNAQLWPGWWKAADRATAMLHKYAGQEVFNPIPLWPQYRQTVALARFASTHWRPLRNVTREYHFEHTTQMVPLMALCALLLFVSSWNLEAAGKLFVALVRSGEPADPTLGNFIGFNPFHDCGALHVIQVVQRLTGQNNGPFDFEAEVNAEIARLQVEHAHHLANDR